MAYHTCKSRACPSCGHRATIAWQRHLWRELPDVSYAHVTLTMPKTLWPFFRNNRQLLHDLPVLGAKVQQEWLSEKYGVQPMIVVILHTFGGHLNFNCHFHILVSEGGLKEDGSGWRANAGISGAAVMPMWRYAVITYLRYAVRAGSLGTDGSRSELKGRLTAEYERPWIVNVKRLRTKRHFLAYAGRYVRRPPIAQHRFRKIDHQEIRFVTKDKREKRTVETTFAPADFVATLADHIPDRYRHSVRYFGLLAPRAKRRTHDAIFALLGQKRLGKPGRLPWAASIEEELRRRSARGSRGPANALGS